jgi:hypothetical protein
MARRRDMLEQVVLLQVFPSHGNHSRACYGCLLVSNCCCKARCSFCIILDIAQFVSWQKCQSLIEIFWCGSSSGFPLGTYNRHC